MELVRDSPSRLVAVYDATRKGYAWAVALAALAFYISWNAWLGPVFAIMQLSVLLAGASYMLVEREEVSMDRPTAQLSIKRSLWPLKPRLIRVPLDEIDDFEVQEYSSPYMRQPKYRLGVRLTAGIFLPLSTAYAKGRPDQLCERMRAFVQAGQKDAPVDGETGNSTTE